MEILTSIAGPVLVFVLLVVPLIVVHELGHLLTFSHTAWDANRDGAVSDEEDDGEFDINKSFVEDPNKISQKH